MRTEAAIIAGLRPQAQQDYWKCCCFEGILEDAVPPLDQTIRLRVVGGCGAVVDAVELALLSPVAAGELGASVSNQVNLHAK